MSAVSVPRRWVLPLLLGVLISLTFSGLVGCGEKQEIDPYVYTSLRAVMQGDTLSPGFLFEIDAPQFEFVRGNVALVREGNELEFLVADDLENRYASMSGALLGVVKTFTPSPTHLTLFRIKRGGVIEADSLPRPEYTLPKLLRAGAIDLETPGAPLPEISWRKTASLKEYLPQEEGDDLLQIQTGIKDFLWVPAHDLSDSVRANPSEQDMAWYAVFPEATLRIVDLTPGAEWALHYLRAKDLPLVGSVSQTGYVEKYADRKVEHGELGHIAGSMKLNWFRVANTFVEGSARE